MSYSFDSRIATCSSEKWMVNSLGQSPCQVATALGGKPCGIDDFILTPLSPPVLSYGSPTQAHLKPCQCNPAIYNLISACALCQGGKSVEWWTYASSCMSSVGPWGIFRPVDIPEGIAVPAWAFSGQISPTYEFSIETAKRITSPDVTSKDRQVPVFGHNGNGPPPWAGGGPQMGSSSTRIDANPTVAAPPPDDAVMSGSLPSDSSVDTTANESTGQVSRGSNTNIGLIVGVAVGSVVALVGIVCLILLWRRKRCRTTTSRDMAATVTSSRNPSLHQFHISYDAPHYPGDYLASRVNALQAFESPPAYTAEDSELQDSAPTTPPRTNMYGQTKFRNFREPVPAALPVHKEGLQH